MDARIPVSEELRIGMGSPPPRETEPQTPPAQPARPAGPREDPRIHALTHYARKDWDASLDGKTGNITLTVSKNLVILKDANPNKLTGIPKFLITLTMKGADGSFYYFFKLHPQEGLHTGVLPLAEGVTAYLEGSQVFLPPSTVAGKPCLWVDPKQGMLPAAPWLLDKLAKHPAPVAAPKPANITPEPTASKETPTTSPAEVADKGGETPNRGTPTMSGDSKVEHPHQAEKVTPPTWSEIEEKTAVPDKPGPFQALASELADREVARKLVDAVIKGPALPTQSAPPASRPAASPSPSTAWKPPSGDPWAAAETMRTFLAGEEVGAEFLDAEKRLIARECVTEIFSPRGVGKSLFALNLALDCARQGLRVLYLDRDNSRFVVKGRLKSFGADPETPNLKIITREKCPPLTNALAWASFPYADYDLVILDSLDSASEGVGEQDSAKPSKAIAPLLDITRREHGPAVLVLGNTVRTGQHSRGSGVIEDRADLVFEVRDATELRPSGGLKHWVEELAPADAGSWAARSVRRKRCEKYQLAFIASKFRIDQEPEPFIVAINTAVEPWTVRDVTDDVDRQGAQARQQRAAEKQELIAQATTALVQEIERRFAAGEPPLAKRRDAEGFLVKRGLKRSEARQCLEARNGLSWVLSALDGRTVLVLPVGCKKEESGHISTPTEPAKTEAITDAECGRPASMHPATFDPLQPRINSGYSDSENVAEGSLFTPPLKDGVRGEPGQEVKGGDEKKIPIKTEQMPASATPRTTAPPGTYQNGESRTLFDGPPTRDDAVGQEQVRRAVLARQVTSGQAVGNETNGEPIAEVPRTPAPLPAPKAKPQTSSGGKLYAVLMGEEVDKQWNF